MVRLRGVLRDLWDEDVVVVASQPHNGLPVFRCPLALAATVDRFKPPSSFVDLLADLVFDGSMDERPVGNGQTVPVPDFKLRFRELLEWREE